MKSQVITWGQDLSSTVAPDEGPITLEATVNSPLAVSYVASPVSVCTVSGTDVTLVGPGDCSLTARQAGDSRYAAATPLTKVLRIRVPQEITFDQIDDQSIDDLLVELEGYADSGLRVSYTSSTKTVCVVRGGFVVLKGAGSCQITARQTGSTIYGAAEPVVVSFEVLKLEQEITFVAPDDQTLETTVLPLEVFSSSDLPVRLSSSNRAVCTVSGTAPFVLLKGEGTCEITASQLGNRIYAAADSVTVTFVVAKAEQLITFDQPSDQILGDRFAVLEATADSGRAVSFFATDTSVCSVRGTIVTLRSVGMCEITARQAGNRVFAAAEDVTLSFTIWQDGNFEITLVDAEAVNTIDAVTWTYGETVELPDLNESPDATVGYTFTGWYTDSVAGTLVTAETLNNVVGDRTLYARWTIKSSVVTYDLGYDGATGAPANASWTFGTLFVQPTAPTRTGYTFDGWFDESDIEITTATVNPDGDDRTLTAHWIGRDFEITLELGDGIGDNSATWTFGEVLSVTPPTLAGYEFAGWYTDAVGGSLVTDTTVNTVVGDRTLYARWTLLPS